MDVGNHHVARDQVRRMPELSWDLGSQTLARKVRSEARIIIG